MEFMFSGKLVVVLCNIVMIDYIDVDNVFIVDFLEEVIVWFYDLCVVYCMLCYIIDWEFLCWVYWVSFEVVCQELECYVCMFVYVSVSFECFCSCKLVVECLCCFFDEVV